MTENFPLIQTFAVRQGGKMKAESKVLALIVLSILFTGCSTSLSPQAINVKDADFRTVENCQFAGDVHGSSGWGNLAASTGIQNAKNEAREQAAALGATHVIWGGLAGGYSPYVSGKTYICK